jgi:PDZ domain-containing protein
MESTTGTTGSGSVPGGPTEPDGAAPGAPDPRRTAIIAGLIVVVAGFLWFATTWTLPYYAIAPGSAIDTSQLVQVDAAHAHPPEGKILLTTVSLGKVTLLEALQGWLDPAVDVVQEHVIAGPDVDENELRRQNLQMMEESKQSAIGVAFEALGVDAIRGAGAEIVEVVSGTPADGALRVGDTIVAVDGAPITVDFEAVRALGAHAPGDEVHLDVAAADGARRTETVVLAAREDDAEKAFLGVGLSTKDLAFDFPFPVNVQSERIGGPSAGLAFTLEVIDNLTDGELTGGLKVATTGTIELDGSVGEVGGVAQKTIAVKRSGATLFLVPSGEYEIAKRFAGGDLEVEAVDTLDEALAALSRAGGNGLALPKLDAEGAS